MTFQAWLHQAIARLAESDSPTTRRRDPAGTRYRPGANLDFGLR